MDMYFHYVFSLIILCKKRVKYEHFRTRLKGKNISQRTDRRFNWRLRFVAAVCMTDDSHQRT
jgi:hypothetical protein